MERYFEHILFIYAQLSCCFWKIFWSFISFFFITHHYPWVLPVFDTIQESGVRLKRTTGVRQYFKGCQYFFFFQAHNFLLAKTNFIWVKLLLKKTYTMFLFIHLQERTVSFDFSIRVLTWYFWFISFNFLLWAVSTFFQKSGSSKQSAATVPNVIEPWE